jgi:fructokinase
MPRYAGIEGGGTKFVVAFGTSPEDLSDPVVYPTTTPDETLERAVHEIRAAGPVDAIGFASFGPLDLRAGSATFGCITKTPKPGWSGADVTGVLEEAFDGPVGVDTDVNGAALGEQRWGSASGLETFVYLTVGTGIGGGGLVSSRPMRGLSHPEMGHMSIPRRRDDSFAGMCPFHGDCLEGMAAGPAIEARWGRRPEDLGDDAAAAIDLEAWYLGTAVANLVVTVSPQRVVIGGGVMKLPGLLEAIRSRFLERLAGYLPYQEVLHAESFIVAPRLGDRAGVLGAIVLAERVVAQSGHATPTPLAPRRDQTGRNGTR